MRFDIMYKLNLTLKLCDNLELLILKREYIYSRVFSVFKLRGFQIMTLRTFL